jgi:hypothetical protein
MAWVGARVFDVVGRDLGRPAVEEGEEGFGEEQFGCHFCGCFSSCFFVVVALGWRLWNKKETATKSVGPQLGRDAKLEVRRNSLGVVVVGVGCAYLIARAMGSNTSLVHQIDLY